LDSFRKPQQQLKFTHSVLISNLQISDLLHWAISDMWELYASLAFVPTMLVFYNSRYPEALNVPLCYHSSSSALAHWLCVVELFLSVLLQRKIATTALFYPCACCLLSPLISISHPPAPLHRIYLGLSN
jgi:hypothetical protein